MQKKNRKLHGAITEYFSNYITETKNAGIQAISTQVSHAIIQIGSMLILFIIVKFILLFFRKIADGIAKIPIIKQFNNLRRNPVWINQRVIFGISCISNCIFNCSYDH